MWMLAIMKSRVSLVTTLMLALLVVGGSFVLYHSEQAKVADRLAATQARHDEAIQKLKAGELNDESIGLESLSGNIAVRLELPDGSIVKGTLVDGAVIDSQLVTGSTVQTPSGTTTVTTADNQTTTQNFVLADGSVVAAKIADGAVGTAKLQDGSVTEVKIKNGVITGGKIATGTITGGLIASDGSVVKSVVGNSVLAATNNNDGSVSLSLTTSCGIGELLKWNGTSWACAADAGGTSYSAGSGLNLTGTTFSIDSAISAVWDAKLGSLNGLMGSVQAFAAGSSGTDFAIVSSGTTHTFNIPDAGASSRGLVTTGAQTFAGAKTFSANINANGGLDIDDVFTIADGGLSATVSHNFWMGLGSGAGRIAFADDAGGDEVNILNAKVGIGTATPNSALQVEDTAGSAFAASSTVTGGAESPTGGVISAGKVGGTADIVTGLSVSAGVFGSGSVTDAFGLYINGENSSSTITNGYLLYLEGGGFAATNNFGIYQLGGSKNYFASSVGVGNSDPQVKLHIGDPSVTDGTNLLRLQDANSTCNFTADSGSPSCGSDATLKKDITALDTDSLLSKVAGLRPVSYHWKTDGPSSALKFGFIAQEVEEQFPELVRESTWVDGSTRKFLDMGGLMPYVVGALKELDSKVTTLETLVHFSETGALTISGDLTVNGKIVLRGPIYASDNTAGEAELAVGQTSARVQFSQPYDNAPIITATPLNSVSGYHIADATKEGFTISVDQSTTGVVRFNWIAVGRQ